MSLIKHEVMAKLRQLSCRMCKAAMFYKGNYVDYIKSKGVRAAVAIKPATEAKVLYPMMEKLDMALVMTVEPGFGGQKLIPETVSKVKELREYAKANGLDTDIQVDGGVTEDNIGMLAEAGANVIVAGSAVFKAADTASAINKIKNAG